MTQQQVSELKAGDVIMVDYRGGALVRRVVQSVRKWISKQGNERYFVQTNKREYPAEDIAFKVQPDTIEHMGTARTEGGSCEGPAI